MYRIHISTVHVYLNGFYEADVAYIHEQIHADTFPSAFFLKSNASRIIDGLVHQPQNKLTVI